MISQNQLIFIKQGFGNLILFHSRFISTKISHYSNTKMNSQLTFAKAGIINMTNIWQNFVREKKLSELHYPGGILIHNQ